MKVANKPSRRGVRKTLIKKISAVTGIQHVKIKRVIDMFLEGVADTMTSKLRAELRGFGIFLLRTRKATVAHDPRTGEEFDMPACLQVRFRPSRKLAEAIEERRGRRVIGSA